MATIWGKPTRMAHFDLNVPVCQNADSFGPKRDRIRCFSIPSHLVKENEVLNRLSRSGQKFMHGIRALMAKNYIDNLSEEVKKGLHTKAAQKLWPSFAPPGYCNVGGDTGKRIIVPDPVLGPIVTKLFNWFATGEYSVKTLARKAYDEGFRFRKSRSKVPVATLHKILRKRIYTGDFDYGGVTYGGSHEPLVTRETWDRVQDILNGRRNQQGKVTHEFAYSGVVRCGHCGCSLVAEVKKGKYVYYHCTGYRGRCPEPYTREEILKRQFAKSLREVVIPSAILQWLNTDLVSSDQMEEATRAQAARRHQAELERSRTRLNLLYEDRLDGRISASIYDQKARETNDQMDRIQQTIRNASATILPPVSLAVSMMTRTSEAAERFSELPRTEQRKLLHLVVKEASWKRGELRMSLKEPFVKLWLSNQEFPRDCNGLRRNPPDFDIWRRGGDSNSRYP